jgi:hypothetical protein
VLAAPRHAVPLLAAARLVVAALAAGRLSSPASVFDVPDQALAAHGLRAPVRRVPTIVWTAPIVGAQWFSDTSRTLGSAGVAVFGTRLVAAGGCDHANCTAVGQPGAVLPS